MSPVTQWVKHRTESKFGERCFSYAGPAAWNSTSQHQAHYWH